MSKIDTTILAAPDSAVTAAPAPASPAKSPDTVILLITLFGVILWGLSVAAFGIPGLYIPALIAVPVIWVLLILITRG